MSITENVNYATNKSLSKVSESAKKYLEKQFNDYLNKICKEYGIDIDQFSTKVPAHFATIDEFEDFNWPEKYKNSKFKINIDINVVSSL